MGSRASLNKVLLIGNLTRDPELRYTPSGAAVCSFGIATNRFYVASDGTKKEETEFIKIVSWNKLAELCSQLLTKGRKVYVEGRLQIRNWETPDGVAKQTTEVVIDDMRILDSRRDALGVGGEEEPPAPSADLSPAAAEKVEPPAKAENKQSLRSSTSSAGLKQTRGAKSEEKKADEEDTVDLDDLPF